MLHVKGYLAQLVLLLPLGLLASPVVSLSSSTASLQPRNFVNEVPIGVTPSLILQPPLSPGSWNEKQVFAVPLMARPEKRSILDYSTSRRPHRSAGLRLTPQDGFPAAQHQQSTNAVATKRDLHYKQHQFGQRTARGVVDSTMIARYSNENISNLHKNEFPSEDINSLDFAREQKRGIHQKSVEKNREQVIYLMAQSARPIVQQQQQQQQQKELPGSVLDLTNLLMKSTTDDDKPTNDPEKLRLVLTRNIQSRASSSEVSSNDASREAKNALFPNQLPAHVINDALSNVIEGYALFYRTIEDEFDANEKSASPTARSIATSLLIDELKKLEQVEEQNEANSAAESLQQGIEVTTVKSSSSEVDEEKEEKRETVGGGKYEFGYRIIDQISDFGHEESRSGRITSGSYHVLLPDGRLQRVQYFVDQRGYHAQVTYAANMAAVKFSQLQR